MPRTVPPFQSNPLPGLPSSQTDWALFLDVDGTLVDIAELPHLVRVLDTLPPLLDDLRRSLGDALALVSGRSLPDVDRLFAPYRFSVAAVHGAEIRIGDSVNKIAENPERLDIARQAFRDFTDSHPGTVWEDKQYAVTLHYRKREAAGPEALALAHAVGGELGEEFEVLEGKMIAEIRFRSASKATAVTTILADRTFRDRIPVYIGDDRTDEDAFRAVNRRGGLSIVVGGPNETQATHGLGSVPEVHRWIDDLARHLRALA